MGCLAFFGRLSVFPLCRPFAGCLSPLGLEEAIHRTGRYSSAGVVSLSCFVTVPYPLLAPACGGAFPYVFPLQNLFFSLFSDLMRRVPFSEANHAESLHTLLATFRFPPASLSCPATPEGNCRASHVPYLEREFSCA